VEVDQPGVRVDDRVAEDRLRTRRVPERAVDQRIHLGPEATATGKVTGTTASPWNDGARAIDRERGWSVEALNTG
jgi:hypothetical protein